MNTYIHVWKYLAEFFLEWEIFQTKVVQKIETHILCPITFHENRAVYEIMWKNMVERQASDDNITRRMRFACWINKATDTHRICNTYCYYTEKTLRERAPMTRLYV
jgi:hypothetical protein